MVWGQHYCRGVATLSKLCDDLSGVQTCVWPGMSERTNTADSFLLWHTQGTKKSIHTSCCFITAQTVHCCPLQKAFTTGTPFSSHMTVIMTLPADGTWLKFFFLQHDVPCHFNCWSDLGLKCWIQVQLAMTTCKRKSSSPLLKGYKTS